jgi:hypothetical protein
MTVGLGPWKRINVLGKAIIGFGGHEGIDSKVMLFFPGTGVHYTMKMLTSSGNLTTSIPIDIHKTWEGQQKRYLPLARGSFNVQPLVKAIVPGLRPSIETIDLSGPEWREREVLPLDNLVESAFGKRELNITETWVEQFTTGTVSEVGQSSTIMAVTGSQNSGGFIINAGDKATYFKMPAMDALDQKLKDSLELTPMAGLEDELDDLLDEREY